MKTTWEIVSEFWDGKKTAFGGIFTLTVGFAIANKWINEVTANYLLGVGAIIIGGGISHKVVKAKKGTK